VRYVVPTQCICVFCVDLRTNSDYFTVQHFITETECVYCAVRCAHTVYFVFCVDLRTNSDYFTVQH
jgi:hypothetical protein